MISTAERIKTNLLLMELCDFNKDLFDTTTLSSDEIRYYNSISRSFDKQIQFYMDWLDSDEAKRIFGDYTRYNDQAFQDIDEYTQDVIEDTKVTADEIINKIYDAGLTSGYKEIRRTKYYNDATKYGLKFLQDYNNLLIDSVNDDLKKHIRTQIFNGIVAGETMPEVAQKILHAHETSLTGKTLSARQRAMMIARTETARAMTQGRLQSYANYGVQEVKILTAGDDNVCPTCRKAADKIYPIEEAANLVPFHPLCRCSVMAYIRHGILQGNPNNDAQIINLTPINSELFDSPFYNPNDKPWRQIKGRKDLPDYLPNNIKDCIINFEKNYLNFSDGNEYGMSYDYIYCEKSILLSLGLETRVSLPVKGNHKNSKILASHCHIDGSPPSMKDIINCLKDNDLYYLIIHGKNDLFIISVKNKDSSNINGVKSEIKRCYKDGYAEALLENKDPYDLIKRNLINNEILNSYMDMSVVIK